MVKPFVNLSDICKKKNPYRIYRYFKPETWNQSFGADLLR